MVVGGVDGQFKTPPNGRSPHTCANVWQHMVWQICLDYPGLSPIEAEAQPMAWVLRQYNGLRGILRRRTKPGK